MITFPAATAIATEPTVAAGQRGGDNEQLAKKLSNPVADMVSVPFQFNYDTDYGSDDKGERGFVNIQPVIPISLNEEWNLISRTILPVIYQDDIAGPSGSQFGLSDIVQSLFFSPVQPSARGWIWGTGPVFLLPTATDDLLGGEKWGAGPTAVGLRQIGPWTYGMLGNHIWSFAGDSDRSDVNKSFIQPFAAYTTPDAWTFTLNTESTYDWEADTWSIPINVLVSKLVRVGQLPVSIGGGVRYWADSPDAGPEGFSARV
jgi:hypothetical protein